MEKTAQFNVGDIVCHKRQAYRAVVIDVDPIFQPSGRHNPKTFKEPFANRNPWYRLLVDNSAQMTYVEECCLCIDRGHQAINNPNIAEHLIIRNGLYKRLSLSH